MPLRMIKRVTETPERTLSQFEAEAIPDDHPVIPQLRGLFGDHTFFLDGNGLNIVELAHSSQQRVQAGKVVNLASWNDEDPLKPSARGRVPCNEPTG
jgi:hypothetical protein